MHEPGMLTIEDCWQPGGRLRIELLEDGTKVRLAGTSDGLIGLARMLLYMAKGGLDDGSVIALQAFGAMDADSLPLELTEM